MLVAEVSLSHQLFPAAHLICCLVFSNRNPAMKLNVRGDKPYTQYFFLSHPCALAAARRPFSYLLLLLSSLFQEDLFMLSCKAWYCWALLLIRQAQKASILLAFSFEQKITFLSGADVNGISWELCHLPGDLWAQAICNMCFIITEL